jgi:hypothetical protein
MRRPLLVRLAAALPVPLLLAACSQPGVKGEEVEWEPLDASVTANAPLLDQAAATGDRFTFRLPEANGLKLWLEADGEVVGRLGIRSEWDSRVTSVQEAVSVFVRDEPVSVLGVGHRNIRVTVALGRAEGRDPWGPRLDYSRVDEIAWAVPWERARLGRPIESLQLAPGRSNVLAEFDYGQGLVQVKLEIVPAGR